MKDRVKLQLFDMNDGDLTLELERESDTDGVLVRVPVYEGHDGTRLNPEDLPLVIAFLEGAR